MYVYKYVICLPVSTKDLTRTRSDMSVHSRIKLEFGNVGFWGEGKTGVPGEKPLEARKNQPTYDARSGNRTQDTLVIYLVIVQKQEPRQSDPTNHNEKSENKTK